MTTVPEAATGLPHLADLLRRTARVRSAIERLNQETVKLLGTAAIAEKLASLGAEPAGGTPEQFASLIKAESLRWGRLIDQLGIKPQ